MTEWILCTETRPPVYLDVLLYVARIDEKNIINDEFLVIGSYNGRKYLGAWNCEPLDEAHGLNVIAWTLLPAKPWKELYEKWNRETDL